MIAPTDHENVLIHRQIPFFLIVASVAASSVEPFLEVENSNPSPKEEERAWVRFPFSMVAWSSPRLSLGGGRATRSLEGKEVWTGERSDLRDSIKRGKEARGKKKSMLPSPAKGISRFTCEGTSEFLVS